MKKLIRNYSQTKKPKNTAMRANCVYVDAKGVANTHTPDSNTHTLLTYRALTLSRSAMSPDSTRPMVLVMPMMEMRKVALAGSMPWGPKPFM